MRKLSNTFLTVNMIFGFVFLALFVGLAMMMFVFASLKDVIMEGIQNGSIRTNSDDPETALLIAQSVLISVGVTFLIFGMLCLPSAIVSASARNSKSKGKFIAAIVLSAISLTYFGVAGGVLGILAINRENRSNIIDAQ
ncbi:MAG: hypothetical protein J6N95_02875 [Bacilli bacterium]|nr:hypothetical protein [Bacilli bacterium]